MRRTFFTCALVVSAALLAHCGEPPQPEPPPPPAHAAEMLFRVDGPIASLDGIVDIVGARLAALGVGRVEAVPGDVPRIRCLIDDTGAEMADEIEAVVVRPGTLEFRVVALDDEADAERAARTAAGDEYVPSDPAYRWVPDRDAGEPEFLVLVPELRLVAAIRAGIADRAPGSRERVDALREELEDVRRSGVFGERDLAAVEAQQGSGPAERVVYFEILDDRRDAFSAFTGAHVGRRLAVILDGAVESAPVIQTALAGRGVITGGGGGGFSDVEAERLAAVLAAGRSLPATLVRESFERVR